MARFLIAISGDEQRWDAMSASEWDVIDEGHRQFTAKAGAAILSAGQLVGRPEWTTVRAGADGRPSPTDGPFVETKEMLGGFYVIEVPDKAEAIELASLLAEASIDHSAVEVIPLVEH